jgi:hypothetical protein
MYMLTLRDRCSTRVIVVARNPHTGDVITAAQVRGRRINQQWSSGCAIVLR